MILLCSLRNASCDGLKFGQPFSRVAAFCWTCLLGASAIRKIFQHTTHRSPVEKDQEYDSLTERKATGSVVALVVGDRYTYQGW